MWPHHNLYEKGMYILHVVPEQHRAIKLAINLAYSWCCILVAQMWTRWQAVELGGYQGAGELKVQSSCQLPPGK